MVIAVLAWVSDAESQAGLDALKGDGVSLAFVDGAGGAEGLEGAGGLFIAGGGTGQGRPRPGGVLAKALELDMPVLATGAGLFLLNEAFGGGPPAALPVEAPASQMDGGREPRRTVYVSPGSKTAAILGAGGFHRLNGRQDVGILDAQRSPRLLASVYSVEDGSVEGLESPENSWTLGFRARLERPAEAPRSFQNVLMAFVERAQDYARPSGKASVYGFGPRS